MRALDGEWLFFEDRTEGRALEQLGPPMSSKFSFRTEEGAVILVRGHGSGHKDVRISLDGSTTDVFEPESIASYRGAWKDGAFEYETEFVRASDNARTGLYRKEFRITPDGLQVRVATDPTEGYKSVGLYRHVEDIPMPTPAKAVIGDMAWLTGAWVGTRGTGGAIAMEERWSPPSGGSLLAVARSVRGGKMSSFEYLRIVERDGGLVYIAQPGGAAPTEFVLAELGKTEPGAMRAVFLNPRHDYPNRIVYELAAEGGLSATIGQIKGGTPRRLDFKREGN
ncbi:MAG: hypothetical protein IT435_09800 [Phycisphaerales bacterium]|nr:hypothetical protein [Phycisphaerales bacterium]